MKISWKIFTKKIPILSWLPQYNGHTALADLVAGITVGLTLIPQSIAYAALADLSPQVFTTIFTSSLLLFIFNLFLFSMVCTQLFPEDWYT